MLFAPKPLIFGLFLDSLNVIRLFHCCVIISVHYMCLHMFSHTYSCACVSYTLISGPRFSQLIPRLALALSSVDFVSIFLIHATLLLHFHCGFQKDYMNLSPYNLSHGSTMSLD